MDYDPDFLYEEGFLDGTEAVADEFDTVITENELSGNPEDIDEDDIFPDADDIGLAGSFAHMMQDEKDYNLPEDIDERNMRNAMSMCTASGDARIDGPNDKPFESYVRACINTPGFFKRRTK